MRQYFLILIAIFSLMACSSDDNSSNEEQQEEYPVFTNEEITVSQQTKKISLTVNGEYDYHYWLHFYDVNSIIISNEFVAGEIGTEIIKNIPDATYKLTIDVDIYAEKNAAGNAYLNVPSYLEYKFLSSDNTVLKEYNTVTVASDYLTALLIE